MNCDAQQNPFGVKRHGVPIADASLRNRKAFANSGITANFRFHLWEAAIEAGATLEELYLLDGGASTIEWFQSKTFKVSLIAWHQGHLHMERHSQDAAIKQPKKK